MNSKVSDNVFIKQLLRDKKYILESIVEDNIRVNAEYEASRKILKSDIDKLERHLEECIKVELSVDDKVLESIHE